MHVKSVMESEAPLGPTCIFNPKGQKAEVTLAVEVLALRAEVHAMKNVSRTRIGGQLTYCGRLGSAILLVPLAGGTVLVVSAPCEEARAFATVALRRLTK